LEINFIKYFTLKRFINAISIITSFWLSRILRKPIVWGMPVSFSIEPTNHCNLKCPECPSGLGTLTRPLGILKLEEFKNLIEQISQTSFYVQLFFQGEPYINKNLPAMIRYAQSKNIYVSISTHGLLINENNIDHLLDNAPDKMIFSVDGLDEESYQSYRVGGSFSQADKALRLLTKKKIEQNKKRPFVELQFIVMKQNEHLINDVIKYGNDAKVDKVVFKTMQISSVENAKKYLPKNEKYSRYKFLESTPSGDDQKIKIKNKLKDHCFALWRTSVITWDGRVVPCCFDKNANYEFGKLNGRSFKEIWLSENYQRFRTSILSNRKEIDICRNCTEGLKVNIMSIEG